MTIKESIEQLNSLIEHFNNGGLDFNATDIEAIKNLLRVNQKYKEVIDKIKKTVDERWYMDSENVGEQIFLKKCELIDILKKVE